MNQNESKLDNLAFFVPIWNFLDPEVGPIAVSFPGDSLLAAGHHPAQVRSQKEEPAWRS